MPVQNTFSALSKRAFGAFEPTAISGAWSVFSFATSNPYRSGIFVSEDGGRFVVTSTAGFIYQSADFGDTYSTVLTVSGIPFEDVAGNYNGQYLLVGVDDPVHNRCYKSNDFGSNWTSVNFSVDQQIYNAVAISRSGEIQLILTQQTISTVNYYRLFRSRDYGNSWENIKTWNTNLPPYPIFNTRGGCISLNYDGSTAVISGSWPILITNLRDNVPTFSNFSGPGSNISLIGIAKQASIVVVGTSSNVWISFDLGITWTEIRGFPTGSVGGWQKISISNDASVIMLAPRNTNDWYISFDYGATWENIGASGGGLTAQWYNVGVSGDGRVRYAISSNSTPHYRNIA